MRRLWTWAGKLWKLVSLPIKPCMYMRSSVRLPSLPDSEGTKECVEEDRGSRDLHC